VPTYNERHNLPDLLHQLLEVDPSLDVLVVDDASPDGTGAIADEFAGRTPRVNVLHRAGKQGLGTAYIAGFRFALEREYDGVIQMDADFQHRPEDLPRLLGAAEQADVVVGSRSVAGGQVEHRSPHRRLLTGMGSAFARTVLRLPLSDCTGGFRYLSRPALEALELSRIRSSGYAFQIEINYACVRNRMRIAEVPIAFPNRTRGESKMSSRIVIEALLLVMTLRLGLTPAAVKRAGEAALESARRHAA
jgi:dolichol-phosphate mannosyltransferase